MISECGPHAYTTVALHADPRIQKLHAHKKEIRVPSHDCDEGHAIFTTQPLPDSSCLRYPRLATRCFWPMVGCLRRRWLRRSHAMDKGDILMCAWTQCFCFAWSVLDDFYVDRDLRTSRLHVLLGGPFCSEIWLNSRTLE